MYNLNPLTASTLFFAISSIDFLHTFVRGQQQHVNVPPPPAPVPIPPGGNVQQYQQYQDFHRRFEYKHSFRAPHLAQPDGSVVFWTITDDAAAQSNMIILAPSNTSKSGSAWNTKPMIESEFWVVEMSIRIIGRGRIGADGLAMWYRTQIPQEKGPVFGSTDLWTGLGLFFDSFDNDYNRDAPFVGIMINDGTRSYDQSKDGGDQNIKAKCQKDFRNKPHPIKVKIEYINNILSVYIHNGNTALEQYELCIKEERIFLPKNGYFGLSAATGGLADDHYALSFEVWSLSPSRPQPPAMMPIEEQQKIDEEFRKREEEYERERERYKKEHPDKVLPDEEGKIKAFQDPLERDISYIFEGQSSMFNILQQMDGKITQLSNQQMSLIQLANQQAGRPAGAPLPVQGVDSGLQRNEATELVQASREITLAVREIKTLVADVQNRILVVDQRLTQNGGQPHAAQQIAGSAAQGDMEYQRTNIDVIRKEVEQIRLNQKAQVFNCPTVDSGCLSSTIFIIVIVTQSILFFVYAKYKSRNEKAKFY